jgi:DNA polymerase III delta prime subunit
MNYYTVIFNNYSSTDSCQTATYQESTKSTSKNYSSSSKKIQIIWYDDSTSVNYYRSDQLKQENIVKILNEKIQKIKEKIEKRKMIKEFNKLKFKKTIMKSQNTNKQFNKVLFVNYRVK